MKLPPLFFWACCIVLLAGCASPRALVSGQSTEAEVRARMGNPTDTRVDQNGERIWDYATAPEGLETYRVRFGPDGKVKNVTQLLTEEQLDNVIPGRTTQAEVRMLLGQPWEDVTYMPGRTWTWRYMRMGSVPGWLIVTFNADGTVSNRIAVVEQTNGDGEPE